MMKIISKNLKALSYSRKKSGFVLVSVLMLGVLLISCASAFSWFVRAQVRTIGREREAIEIRSMANVLTEAVIKALAQVSAQVNYDSPADQRWYQPFIIPMGDLGIWIAQITPLDDKIPLRNLFLPDGNTMRREIQEMWEELWSNKLGKANMADIVLDFFDKNNKPRVGGVEREYFLNRSPYDTSELLLLSRDVPEEILFGEKGKMGLVDYCTVYSDGKININVAPAYVLELMPGLDVGGVAERIERERQETPLKSLADIQKIPGASAKTTNKLTNLISFKSRYFLLKIQCLDDTGSGGKSFNIIIDRTTRQIVKWEES